VTIFRQKPGYVITLKIIHQHRGPFKLLERLLEKDMSKRIVLDEVKAAPYDFCIYREP
jgi:hypothetical protein